MRFFIVIAACLAITLIACGVHVPLPTPPLAPAQSAWLAGAAKAASIDGCTGMLVQAAGETLQTAIARFGMTATEGECLILYPITATDERYSLAWGGVVNGKDLLYMSDVGKLRIWNGVAQ